MQERRNSIVYALELRLSYTYPSMLFMTRLWICDQLTSPCWEVHTASAAKPTDKSLSKLRNSRTMHHTHDDVIKWKHFPRNWPFVRGIHRSPVNSPHKGQWRGALKFSLICAWINDWVNNREAGDLRRHRTHYDVIVMKKSKHLWLSRNGHSSHCEDVPAEHSQLALIAYPVHDYVIEWKHFPHY